MTTGQESFENFLRKESMKSANSNVDKSKRVKEWLDYVNTLYNDVENWLFLYKKNQSLQVTYESEMRSEEIIGTYSIRRMIIKIVDEIVSLDPVGTILIGSIGRVDIVGRTESIKLVLVSAEAKGFGIFSTEEKKLFNSEEGRKQLVWKITSNPPRIRYTDLNQDTFLSSLIKVING